MGNNGVELLKRTDMSYLAKIRMMDGFIVKLMSIIKICSIQGSNLGPSVC